MTFMRSQPRQPDPIARLLSHALVGAIAVFLFKKAGGGTAATAALFSIIAHEALDAPVAQALTDLDI
jgi:hypothetical protein